MAVVSFKAFICFVFAAFSQNVFTALCFAGSNQRTIPPINHNNESVFRHYHRKTQSNNDVYHVDAHGDLRLSSSIFVPIAIDPYTKILRLSVSSSLPMILLVKYGMIPSMEQYDALFPVDVYQSENYGLTLLTSNLDDLIPPQNYPTANAGGLFFVLSGGLSPYEESSPAGDIPTVSYKFNAALEYPTEPETVPAALTSTETLSCKFVTVPGSGFTTFYVEVVDWVEVLQLSTDTLEEAFHDEQAVHQSEEGLKICAEPPGRKGDLAVQCGTKGSTVFNVHRPRAGRWKVQVYVDSAQNGSHHSLKFCHQSQVCPDHMFGLETPTWVQMGTSQRYVGGNPVVVGTPQNSTHGLLCLGKYIWTKKSLGTGNSKTLSAVARFNSLKPYGARVRISKMPDLSLGLLDGVQHFIALLDGTEIGAHMLVQLRASNGKGDSIADAQKLALRLRYGSPVTSNHSELDVYTLYPQNATVTMDDKNRPILEWVILHPIVPFGAESSTPLFIRVETIESVRPKLETTYSLKVRFRDCIEQTCPSSRGECEELNLSNGFLSSKCNCYNGYGGEMCEIVTISSGFRFLQTALLVLSNFPALVALILTHKRSLHGISAGLLFSALSSSLYHMCDMGYNTCILDYHSTKVLDVFALLLLIIVVVLNQSPLPSSLGIPVLIMFLGPMITVVDKSEAVIGTEVIVFLFVSVFLLLSVTWGGLVIIRSRRNTGGLLVQKILRTLVLILWRSNIFKWKIILAAWITIVSGYLTFLFQRSSTYYIWHSIWHMASFISVILFVIGKSNSQYIPSSNETRMVQMQDLSRQDSLPYLNLPVEEQIDGVENI